MQINVKLKFPVVGAIKSSPCASGTSSSTAITMEMTNSRLTKEWHGLCARIP